MAETVLTYEPAKKDDAVIGYVISSCTSVDDNGIVIIPDNYNGASGNKPVIAIKTEAFKDKNTIKAIVLPSFLEKIEDRAFKSCTKIEKIIVPNKVTTFGNNIFDGCSLLKKVYLAWNTSNEGRTFGTGIETVFYYPLSFNLDMDFLGFTFNGKHSYLDLGVYRIINDRM